MLRAKFLVLSIGAALTLAACGGEEGGGGDPEPVSDPQVLDTGKTTAQSSSALAGIQAGADSSAAKGPITSVGGSIMALVNQYRALQLRAQAEGHMAPLAVARQAQTAEGTDTIKFEDDHLSANVHYSQPQATIHYVVELDIVPQEGGGFVLDGTFDLEFQTTQQQYTIDYDYAAVYSGLTLDAMNCPVAGSLSVDYDLALSGEILDQYPPEQRRQIENQMGGQGNITLTFGPDCGDVAAEGT